MVWCLDKAEEDKIRKGWAIVRDKTAEAYYAHSGKRPGAKSFMDIWHSKAQLKVVALACCFYAFQTCVYATSANYVVYITFHNIDPTNPSYPGNESVNGTNPWEHRELFDVGFQLTPDWSHRPWWLKAAFVDLMVTLAQFAVPLWLLVTGETFAFVNYTSMVGILNIMKGAAAIMTILPPARFGEKCWHLNWTPEEMEEVRTKPFFEWFFRPWGTVHGCNDMIWSGHTSQSCLGMLFFEKTLRHAGCPCAIRFLLAIYFAIYVWSVLACRMHYSIDVFLAMLLATALFTHTSLRFWIWACANTICCNSKFGDDEQSEEEEEENAGLESDSYDR